MLSLLIADRAALGAAPGPAIEGLRQRPGRPEVVVVRSGEDAEDRAALLSAGALAVLNADLDPEAQGAVLTGLLERRRQFEELARAARGEGPEGLAELPSANAAMREMLRTAARIARSDSTVLLLGETGTGKEWLARALHGESRRSGELVAVNCAAMPETLLESELFGHERGAFTGATRARRGSFERAHRGTIFLDEIAEMSPHLQAKLLRVLQERRVPKLGSEREVPVDVRILAATSRDLDVARQSGEFRQDLYYRLAVVTLRIPPLRERPEDLPALARSCLDRLAGRIPTQVRGISDEAIAALRSYSWPGNVRELFNVLERAVLLASGDEITADDLLIEAPRREEAASASELWRREWLDLPLARVRREVSEAVERRYLEELLRHTGGHVQEAARRAGINRRSLYDRLEKHGLDKKDYRS